MFRDAPRHAVPVGDNTLDSAVGQVGHVIEFRDVDAARHRETHEHLVAAAGTAFVLPFADHVADGEHDLFAVAKHCGIDEIGNRLGVEGRVSARENDRIVCGPVARMQRNASQVERGQQVGVAEFGRKRDAEHVECLDRPVRIDGELTDVVVTHDPLHVGEHRIRAFGEDPVTLVEDFIQDLNALVRQPHFISIGVHECPSHRYRVPVLDDRVEFATDVLDRFADREQQGFQSREE